jgi:opacity protein-like surface antigen
VKLSGIPRISRVTSLLALALSLVIAAPVRAAEPLNEAAWKTGGQWLSIRAGYAKAQTRNGPNGNFGWGFGYSQMVSRKVSLGANFQQDLLGKFGGAALIDMPLAFESLWHFKLKGGLHPYVGGGLGTVYRKAYRTGDDWSNFQPMYFGSFGANVPVDKSHLLGLDVRIEGVSSDQMTDNPVFLSEKSRSVHWSIKINYATTY